MRIVAGKYGSRPLESVQGNTTRPTSDKVKGAIFSSLGNMFSSGNFLDCYSGTGSMALEAISRGMDQAVMIDKDRRAIQTIRHNVKNLDAQDQCKVIQGDVFRVLEHLAYTFDYVFIDPPYAKQKNIELIERICQLKLLNPKAIVVVESLSSQEWPDVIEELVKYKEKEYRGTKITYYQKEEDQ